MTGGPPRLTAYAVAVLDVVDAIPRGRVLCYGDVADVLGRGGPRSVGQVLRWHGDEVPWHRVVHADGTPPAHKRDEQLDLLRRDRTPLAPAGDRVDMARARWDGGLSVAGAELDRSGS